MRRTTFALASAALAVSTLAACGGGGDSDAYCDTIESAGSTIENMSDEADFDKALSSFEDIRDAAPSDIKDDWGTLIDVLKSFEEGDFEGVDQDAAQKASENIEKQVKDECDIDMGDLG